MWSRSRVLPRDVWSHATDDPTENGPTLGDFKGLWRYGLRLGDEDLGARFMTWPPVDVPSEQHQPAIPDTAP